MFTPDTVHVSAAHPVMVLGHRADVVNLIPGVREGVLDGSRIIVVPHRPEETKVLRNLGLDAPSPILTRYAWAGLTPYEAQRQTAALLTDERRAFVLNEFGTGKTRSVLFAFDYLRSVGLAKSMLVAAPLSTLWLTWAAEIRDYFPHLTARVVHGPHRRAQLELDADIYIINHDGLRHTLDALENRLFDVFAFDELTAAKNARAKRSIAARKIAGAARWRWGLTGSPIPQGPEDAHGQVLLINPERVPLSFRRWQDKVMTKVSNFTYLPKPNATEIVYEAMQPAVRYLRKDVIELPPMTVVQRSTQMSGMQAKVYEQVKKTLQAQIADGQVTAMNEGVKRNKLMQVACGFIYMDDGEAATLDGGNRVQTILEVLEEAQAKFLVFCPYVAGVDILHKALAKKYPQVGKVYGATSSNERRRVFEALKEDPDMPGIVAHPKTMSHGLNLPEADMIVWASPTNLETYEQANARVTRPGQKHKQMVAQIIGTREEAMLYKRLDNRASLQGALLDMFQ